MAKATIWTQEGCPLCERVKACLAAEGYEEREVNELMSGTEKNHEAMVQLAMQDMELPLVRIDGAFVGPNEILARHGTSAA